MLSKDVIFNIILNTIDNVANGEVDIAVLNEDTLLFDGGLGLNSLDFINIVVNLEENTNTIFPDDKLLIKDSFTLGELLQIVLDNI